MESNKATRYVSTKENKLSTLRGPAQLADLQGALCVPTYNLTNGVVVADLGILVAADQAPTHTLPNSTSTQSRGAQAEHKHENSGVGGSSSSGSAPADDTATADSKEVPLPIREHICVASGAKGDYYPSLSSDMCGMDGCGTSLLNGKNRSAR